MSKEAECLQVLIGYACLKLSSVGATQLDSQQMKAALTACIGRDRYFTSMSALNVQHISGAPRKVKANPYYRSDEYVPVLSLNCEGNKVRWCDSYA